MNSRNHLRSGTRSLLAKRVMELSNPVRFALWSAALALLSARALAFLPSGDNPYGYSYSQSGFYQHYKVGDGFFHDPGCTPGPGPSYWCDCPVGAFGSLTAPKVSMTGTTLTVEYWIRNAYCNQADPLGSPNRPANQNYFIHVYAINPDDGIAEPVSYIAPYWEHGSVSITGLNSCSRYIAVLVIDAFLGCPPYGICYDYSASKVAGPVGQETSGRSCLPDFRNCSASGTSPASAAKPINVGSGNMRYEEMLFSVSESTSSLSFSLAYNSRNTATGPAGYGFTHSFSQTIKPLGGNANWIQFVNSSGEKTIYYSSSPGTVDFAAVWPADATGKVKLDATVNHTYTLTDLDGTVTTFDSPTGAWKSTADRWGNTTSGAYSGSNLTSVTDPEGRAWILGYDASSRLTSISDPDSHLWKFAYDGSGHLQSIRDPLHDPVGETGNPWRQYTYVIGNPAEPTVLARVQDDLPAVLEGHEYDSSGRAISSWSGDTVVTSGVPQPGTNARDLVTLSYTTPLTQTVVTSKIDNTTNQVSTFTLISPAGRFLPITIVGNCASCGGAGGDKETYTYDGFNRPLTKTVGDDTLGEQVQTRFTYDANGMVLTRTDAVGVSGVERTTTYTYNYSTGTPSGGPPWPSFVTSITDTSVANPPASKVTTYSWNSTGTRETTLTASVSGYLSSGGSQTTYTTTTIFDGSSTVKHRVLEVDGPEQTGQPPSNRKTTFVYYSDGYSSANNRGRLQTSSAYTSATAKLCTQFDSYDIFKTAQTVIDPTGLDSVCNPIANGVRVTKTTDAKGRVTSVTSKQPAGDPSEPPDYVTAYNYDTRDRLTTVTLPLGNQLQYAYEDGMNRLTDTIRANSSGSQQERLHLTLNAIGDKVQEDAQLCSNPANPCLAGDWTTKRTDSFTYDTHNRLQKVTHPDATHTHVDYTYDSRGNLKTVQDENHTSANTTYDYDALNRLTKVTQTLVGAPAVSGTCAAAAGSIATCYLDSAGHPGYDSQDNLTSVIDPNGNQTTYAYDDFRRMQSQTSPVGGTTTYSYDAAGNLSSSTDANTATTTRTYDAANWILSASSVRSGFTTENVNWGYDDSVSTHYGKGRLASMTDPSGSTIYTYERRGLVKHEAKTIDLNTYTLAYGYDANGNRSSITYPSGRIVNYTFDFADRPITACSGGTGPTCTGSGAIFYVSATSPATYQPFGPESTLTYGTSPAMTRTMTYDQRYHPTRLTLQGSSTIYDYYYGEDAVGNITSICQSSGTCSSPPGVYDRVFGYDDLNRLTSAKSGNSLWGSASGNGFTYDSMGNMTSLTLGSRAVTFTYAQIAGHYTSRLATASDHTPATVSYDPAGNESGVGSGTLTYSSRDYLASGDGLAYTYDGRGLRVATARTGVNLFPVSLTVDPQSVKGGGTATGTVTLNDNTGGAVTLVSSDSSVTFPGGTTVNVQNSYSASFTIATTAPASDRKVLITATMAGMPNGVTVTAVLTVTVNPQLLLVSLSPRTVQGGTSSTGTILLNGPAPSPSGASVTLVSSDTSVATVTSPVVVQAGATTKTFPVNTSGVSTSKSVDIKATYPTGVDFHASLVVVNYAVQGIAPSGPLLAKSGRPLLLASLSPWKDSILAGTSLFRGSDSGPAGLRLSLNTPEVEEGFGTGGDDPIPERMQVILAASYPGSPKRAFIYSPEMNLLAESELSRPREKAILYEYIWFNGHPVAQVDAGVVTHWTFTDHLGTPLIQTTGSQAVWWRAEYEPYGRVFAYNPPGLADQHQPLRLPGQEAEQLNLGSNGATERSYNIFRWYRPTWGRYTQTDPVGLSVGLNLYQYGLGDPLLMTDPLGLRVRVCCKKIVLGFRHCYIESDDGATTGLHGTQSLGGYARALFCKDIGTVFGPGSGASDQRGSPRGADFDLDPRIAKQCGDWAEEPCRDPDQCVADVASRYPSPSRYCLFGPNSNTFASFAARQCGIPKPPVAGGFLTPGWNSPPLLPTLPPFPVYPLPAIR